LKGICEYKGSIFPKFGLYALFSHLSKEGFGCRLNFLWHEPWGTDEKKPFDDQRL
jgi:hypothetical protein